MAVKLMLDHSALHLFCSGDPGFELELKTKILESALRGKIKTLLHELGQRKVTEVAAQATQDAILELRSAHGIDWAASVFLTPANLKSIENAVTALVGGEILSGVKRDIAAGFSGYIRQQVTSQAQAFMENAMCEPADETNPQTAEATRELRGVLTERAVFAFNDAVRAAKEFVRERTEGFDTRIEAYLKSREDLALYVALDRLVAQNVEAAVNKLILERGL